MNKKFKRTLSAIVASSMMITAASGMQITGYADNTTAVAETVSKYEHLFDREWLTKYIDNLA